MRNYVVTDENGQWIVVAAFDRAGAKHAAALQWHSAGVSHGRVIAAHRIARHNR